VRYHLVPACTPQSDVPTWNLLRERLRSIGHTAIPEYLTALLHILVAGQVTTAANPTRGPCMPFKVVDSPAKQMRKNISIHSDWFVCYLSLATAYMLHAPEAVGNRNRLASNAHDHFSTFSHMFSIIDRRVHWHTAVLTIFNRLDLGLSREKPLNLHYSGANPEDYSLHTSRLGTQERRKALSTAMY
jgi:hypothetical protein